MPVSRAPSAGSSTNSGEHVGDDDELEISMVLMSSRCFDVDIVLTYHNLSISSKYNTIGRA